MMSAWFDARVDAREVYDVWFDAREVMMSGLM
jgi:hypothetical protein